MKTETKKTLAKLLLSGGIIACIVIAVYFVMRHFGLSDLTQDELQVLIENQGAKGPLIFILISFLQVTLVPIPGAVTILAGNYVFGPVESFIYSYIGIYAGAMVAFTMGKLFGRPFVNWIVGSKETVDEWLYKIRGKEGVLLFFMFIFPLFPDDILCAVAGLLPFSYASFATMQLITRATSIFGVLFFMSGQILPWNIWGLLVVLVIAAVLITAFIYALKYAEEIEDFISSLSRKVYYGEKFFLKRKEGKKAGKRIRVDKKFATQNSPWRVAGVYVCDEGFVIDFYSYSQRKRHIPEKDFSTVLEYGGEVIPCEDSVRHLSHAKKFGKHNKDEKGVRRFVQHYKLELFSSRAFIRAFYPCNTEKSKEKLEKLVLEVEHKTKSGADKKTRLKLTREKKGFRKTIKELFAKSKKKK